MCLILTIVFLVLAAGAVMDHDWTFASLYSAIALFFIWLLQNNVRAVLNKKGRCASGCSLSSLFPFLKRAKQQDDHDDLGQ